jgi:hypothetical protein
MCLAVNKVKNHDEFLEARPFDKASLGKEKIFVSDFLAQSTQLTKSSFETLFAGIFKVQKSTAYQ